MKKSLLAATLFAVTLTASSLAQAQPAPPAKPVPGAGAPPVGQFKDITRAEALRRAGEQFDSIDANKDGTITQEEMRAAMDKRMKEGARPRPMAAQPGGQPQR